MSEIVMRRYETRSTMMTTNRPLVDGEMSRFMGWVGGTHTMRYHAHYHTSGLGHVYQQRYRSFPIQDDEHFFVVCRYVERNALRAKLVKRAEDWQWGSLWRWLQDPEPDPKLLSSWPLLRLPRWADRVNEPLSKRELDVVRISAQRGYSITFGGRYHYHSTTPVLEWRRLVGRRARCQRGPV